VLAKYVLPVHLCIKFFSLSIIARKTFGAETQYAKFQQLNVTIYEGQYESKAYFFLRNYNYNEIYVSWVHTLQN